MSSNCRHLQIYYNSIKYRLSILMVLAISSYIFDIILRKKKPLLINHKCIGVNNNKINVKNWVLNPYKEKRKSLFLTYTLQLHDYIVYIFFL